MSARKTGSVKWFNSKKGFGFITPADGGEDIFVHQSEIRAQGFRSLAENEPVEFDTVIDENGRPKASNVTGPNGSNVQGAPKPQFRQFEERGEGGAGGPGGFRPRGGFGGPRGGYGGNGGGFRRGPGSEDQQ